MTKCIHHNVSTVQAGGCDVTEERVFIGFIDKSGAHI